MQLNADLTKRVVVFSDGLPWTSSPLPGVERRMLERDGDEIARASTIVRYAPGSYFDAHTHDAGEEFIVLDGVFSDEMGDFPQGMYVRNPPGSKHRPYTDNGCTIFVKLRQFKPTDQAYVRIDTNDAVWVDGWQNGHSVLPLHEFGDERVSMHWLDANTSLPECGYPRGMEFLVLEGTAQDGYGHYPLGTWVRNPSGFSHQLNTTESCLIYMKTGHLINNEP